ncbi:MAG: peptide chain release factor N(5)-glutamine methyltransferase [Pseudomonadota bacterium]
MQRGQLLAKATADLSEAGVPDAARDARRLLAHAAGLDGAALAGGLTAEAAASEEAAFAAAVAARRARKPVSQITGSRLFWGRPFQVTGDVLDPRPETETVIAACLDGPAAGRILDLGTGSGALLLTLLAEWPTAAGLGTDISAPALAVARQNAAALGVADRATFQRADWLAGIDGSFELIVCNPPYIAADALADLAPDVRDWEPRGALTDEADGLSVYRRLAPALAQVLAPGGRAIFEVGEGQAGDVRAIFAATGWGATVHTDLDGRERAIELQNAKIRAE